MYLKQYTAKVIKSIPPADGKEHGIMRFGYDSIFAARFYAGRVFAVSVFPSHEA